MPQLAGELHPSAKLSDEGVREIRAWYTPGVVTFAELATAYSVTKQTVAAVIARQTWQHVCDG